MVQYSPPLSTEFPPIRLRVYSSPLTIEQHSPPFSKYYRFLRIKIVETVLYLSCGCVIVEYSLAEVNDR
jgi:hypothetical protein